MNTFRGKLKYRTYIDYGYYADRLERYFSLFPQEKILVLQFERFVQNPEEVIRVIFKFLGVNPDVLLNMDVPRNVTIPSTSLRRAVEIMRKIGILDLIPKDVRGTVRKAFERKVKKKTPPISEVLLQQLRSHFHERVKRLVAL